MTGRRASMVARDARVVELASQGKTASEIARIEGVHAKTAYEWARAAGVKLPKSSSYVIEKRQSRADKMTSMYRQGVTLAKIGAQFKLTRERVRQILAKAGVTSMDGGVRVVAASAKTQKSMAREAKYMAAYGHPYEVVKQLRKDRVTHAYNSQRSNAQKRGIDWKLNFQQWFAIWQASGKLHLRGRGKGRYIMSRVSDAGCYEIGNVHIQLGTENSREAVDQWRDKVKANRGVYCLYPGRDMAWWAKVGKQSLGFFRTEAEAVEARAAYLKDHPEIQEKVSGRGYAHIKAERGRAERFQVMVAKTYVGSFATAEQALAARADFIAQRELSKAV